ncbi:MAG: hypothetical protein WBL21_12845 [Salinimicrobium sp.]
MDLIISLVAIDVIASKFLRSYIGTYRSQGVKSIVQTLLERWGLENDVWLSFFVTVFITGTSVFLLNDIYSAPSYQLLFIFTGLFTTILNLGAAHSAYFGRMNFVTKRLLKSDS